MEGVGLFFGSMRSGGNVTFITEICFDFLFWCWVILFLSVIKYFIYQKNSCIHVGELDSDKNRPQEVVETSTNFLLQPLKILK